MLHCLDARQKKTIQGNLTELNIHHNRIYVLHTEGLKPTTQVFCLECRYKKETDELVSSGL